MISKGSFTAYVSLFAGVVTAMLDKVGKVGFESLLFDGSITVTVVEADNEPTVAVIIAVPAEDAAKIPVDELIVPIELSEVVHIVVVESDALFWSVNPKICVKPTEIV